MIPNRPPADMVKGPKEEVTQTTEKTSYYKLCPKDGKRDLAWRAELGTQLVASMDAEAWGGKLFCLKNWPENYVLYDRYTVVGDKSTIVTYLYGHPEGPKKRFKNALEFLPHLMWLAVDKEHKKDNCGCAMCKGTGELEKRPPAPPPIGAVAAAAASAATTAATKAKGKAATTSKSPAPQVPTPIPQQQQQITQQQITQQQMAVPRPTPPNTQQLQQPPKMTVPTPPPYNIQILQQSPSCQERLFDLQYSFDIYRKGECVWFQASPDDKSNWSLGAILQKEPQGPGYMIQILSSPLNRPPPHRQVTHDRIRPWLAWTAPAPQQEDLRLPNVRFENVNWENYRFEPNVEVDASIIVAKEAEGTYSPVDLLPVPHNMHRFYSGLWFGAEKIWVGEGIRLKRRFSAPPPPPSQKGQVLLLRDEVLVVSCIFEKFDGPTPNPPGRTGVYLTGDIFLLQPALVPPGTNPAHLASPPPFLPDRMRKDAQQRNQISVQNRLWSTWQLVLSGVTVPMEDVKGRWYESSILMKDLVNGGEEEYLAALRNGGLSDLGNLLNQMGGQEGFGIGGGRGW
ncbi:hypothetical protein DFH27DRAFT_480182, partial [Peziza echinospora]